jgi:hypothetical protein
MKQGTRRRELWMMVASTWLLALFGAFAAIRYTTQLVERWSQPQVRISVAGGAIRKVTQPHPSTAFLIGTIAVDLAALFVLWLAVSVTQRVRSGEGVS